MTPEERIAEAVAAGARIMLTVAITPDGEPLVVQLFSDRTTVRAAVTRTAKALAATAMTVALDVVDAVPEADPFVTARGLLDMARLEINHVEKTGLRFVRLDCDKEKT